MRRVSVPVEQLFVVERVQRILEIPIEEPLPEMEHIQTHSVVWVPSQSIAIYVVMQVCNTNLSTQHSNKMSS